MTIFVGQRVTTNKTRLPSGHFIYGTNTIHAFYIGIISICQKLNTIPSVTSFSKCYSTSTYFLDHQMVATYISTEFLSILQSFHTYVPFYSVLVLCDHYFGLLLETEVSRGVLGNVMDLSITYSYDDICLFKTLACN